MKRYDATTITRTRDERRQALQAGVAAIRHPRARENFAWPLDGLEEALDRMEAEPAGMQYWPAEPVERRAPRLEVVWAADYAGRRHLRVLAGRVQGARLAEVGFLLGVAEGAMPPAWLLFRDRAYLLHEPDGVEVVHVCDCGAAGTLAEIAWMGSQCGPCHDRSESGEPVPRPFARPVLVEAVESGHPPQLTPDGRFLLVRRPEVALLDLATGASQACRGAYAAWLHPGGAEALCYPGIAPDRMAAWTATTGELADLPGLPLFFHQAVFAADGNSLAGFTLPGNLLQPATLGVWAWPGATPRLQRRLSAHPSCLALSPDGGTVALGDADAVVLLPVADPDRSRRLSLGLPDVVGRHDEVQAVAFAPDGRRLAAYHGRGVVGVFDLASGTVERVAIPVPENTTVINPYPGLAFTPTGDAVLVWDRFARIHVVGLGPAVLWATLSGLLAMSNGAALGGEWLVTTPAYQATFWPWRPLVEYARRRAGR